MPWWPASDARSLPVATSHNLSWPGVSNLSQTPEDDATVLPSGEKATQRIDCVWPVSRCVGCFLAGSHNSTAKSAPPRASILPSAEKARLMVWRVGDWNDGASDADFHSRAILSSAVVTSRLPSGEKTALHSCP